MYQSQYTRERGTYSVYAWASFVVKKSNVERGEKRYVYKCKFTNVNTKKIKLIPSMY